MDFEQIRAFLHVASLKSFSEAGEKMFISQPSVSVRIKALEEELGVILFDRSKSRELILTEAGIVFHDYAQSIINLQDECREKMSGRREEATGLVYIGASTVPGTYLLPSRLAKFKTKYPSIGFNIVVLDTSAVVEGILNYSFDLGFVGRLKQDEKLVYTPLLEDELVLCVRKGLLNRTDYKNGVPVEVCFSHTLLMREKGSATRQLLEKKLSESGFDIENLPGVTYINSLEGIKQAVGEGLGIAILSKLSIEDMANAGKIDIFPIAGLDLRRFLYLVYHQSRILGGAARKLRDFFVEEFTN